MKKLAILFAVFAFALALPTFAQMTGGAPSGGAPVVTEPAPLKLAYFAPGESLPDGSYDIVQVIDADTVVALAGDVLRSVRVLGVDSPEKGEAYRDESSAFASALLSGETVTLEQDSQAIDQYGRALAYVTLPGGQDYSLLLLQAGLATAFDRYPVTRTALYDVASAGAKSVGKSLWQGSPFKDYNCPQFASRALAQSFYSGAFTFDRPDPSRLDPDKNGRACESLRR